jgi:transcription elongation GreA/GreB family factor
VPRFDKAQLRDELLSQLTHELETLARAHQSSLEGATHEENKSESDKDMRATEASYVARGQALRVEALEADVTRVTKLELRAFDGDAPIALGALVELKPEASAQRTVFVAPAGGGARLAGGAVQVVTPASPLGRALLGAQKGDFVEVEHARGTEELEVTGVE